MSQDPDEGWRADLDEAYMLFATHHQERLTSKVLLETALEAMCQRADQQIETPVFAERAEAVPEDLERLLGVVVALLRAEPGVNGEQLRDAAIEALVRLRPDGHTFYWSRVEDVPFRPFLVGDAGLVSKLMPCGVGYVRWAGWVRKDDYRISDEVRKRLEALLRDGARAWLFDLRGNRGGSLAECQRLASMFLNGESVWVNRYADRVEHTATDRTARLPDPYQLPIAVVIDANTWSASEIFAFALRQYGRAQVFGERSAGRVGQARFRTLPGGGFLGVAVAVITGPHGERYNGVGITPDIAVTSDRAVDVAAEHLCRELALASG